MDLEFGAALGAGAALARVFAFDLGAISQESVGLSYTCWTVLDKLQRMSPLNQQKYKETMHVVWENDVFLSICCKNQWKPYGNHQETMEFVDNATWKPCGNHWKPTGNHVFSGRKSYLTMT